MNKKIQQISIFIPILLSLLVIVPLSALAVNETSTEIMESAEIGGAPPIPQPPRPTIPELTIPAAEELKPEETTTPPAAVSKEAVSAPQTELQKISEKINYLIWAVAIEFLLILIIAINICVLYKRLKKP